MTLEFNNYPLDVHGRAGSFQKFVSVGVAGSSPLTVSCPRAGCGGQVLKFHGERQCILCARPPGVVTRAPDAIDKIRCATIYVNGPHGRRVKV